MCVFVSDNRFFTMLFLVVFFSVNPTFSMKNDAVKHLTNQVKSSVGQLETVFLSSPRLGRMAQ